TDGPFNNTNATSTAAAYSTVRRGFDTLPIFANHSYGPARIQTAETGLAGAAAAPITRAAPHVAWAIAAAVAALPPTNAVGFVETASLLLSLLRFSVKASVPSATSSSAHPYFSAITPLAAPSLLLGAAAAAALAACAAVVDRRGPDETVVERQVN